MKSGTHHTEETKRKIAESLAGVLRGTDSEAHRAARCAAQQRRRERERAEKKGASGQ